MSQLREQAVGEPRDRKPALASPGGRACVKWTHPGSDQAWACPWSLRVRGRAVGFAVSARQASTQYEGYLHFGILR